MQALYPFISVETPMQLPQTSFITKPRSPIFAEPNTTAEFVWTMNNCIRNSNLQVKIVTKHYDLYPIPQGPIRNIIDYNATAKCEGNNTIIALTIIFNENVLDNAEYVVCKVVKRLNNGERITLTRSMVNFTATVTVTSTSPLRGTTLNSESTIIIEPTSTSIIEATTGSGYRQCVHCITFVLCFLLLTLL